MDRVIAFAPRFAWVWCIAAVALACQDTADEEARVGVNAPGGAEDQGDEQRKADNPELYNIATQYFPGTDETPAKKRLFRLTRSQLDFTTRTLLPAQFGATAMGTLPSDPLQTNYEYADNLSFNDANFTPYTNWVSQMVTAVRAAPESVINCKAAGDSPQCLSDQAKKFVTKAFRGVVTDAQVAQYADFFTSSVAPVGLPAAVADLVDVTLTSPNYVFRNEVTTNAAGELTPAEVLQSVTYTLADAPPETVGLSSLTPGTYVGTSEARQQTVDQVLRSAEARTKLLRFFLAWLEVKEPEEFTIAASTFPEFTPEVAAAVVDETKAFLTKQLAAAAPRMKDLTEVTQTIVSKAESFLYSDNGTVPPAGPLDVDPTKRIGLFTQPAVLASHSGPTTTRLVKRGVFFTRKVMCMPMGNPGTDVNTTIPPTAVGSERQKVESLTAPAQCAGCHAVINPFGFMLENYDAIGRWRTVDNGVPIDPKIHANFLDEGPLATNTAVDALRGFTRSLRFQQCFTRQLFRFFTGRDEAAGDDPLLRRMFFDFANKDQQEIIGMLHTLASAPTFALRSEAQ